MEKINVTIFNEFVHEKNPEIKKIYPKGIHGAIKEMLEKDKEKRFNVKVATLEMEENGLTDDVLDNTDVLIWWGHLKHADVLDSVAEKVVKRVNEGMGFIPLHSAHLCKPFKMLMGTICRSKWRENDEKERLWVIEPSHPITAGIPEYIELEKEETYGERFEIPTPEKVIFISWFSGGEVFRSGCTFTRGLGKIFYFRPGHEEYPTYYREDIIKILSNAIVWAKPSGGPKPTLGFYEAIEKVGDKFAGKSEAERKHLNIK